MEVQIAHVNLKAIWEVKIKIKQTETLGGNIYISTATFNIYFI